MTIQDGRSLPGKARRPKLKDGRQIKMPAKFRYVQEIKRLNARVKELEEQLSGGRLSPDGVWCDITYAARYVHKSKQTLRNLRSQGTGPVSFGRGSGVKYMVEYLMRYNAEGYTQADYDREQGK